MRVSQCNYPQVNDRSRCNFQLIYRVRGRSSLVRESSGSEQPAIDNRCRSLAIYVTAKRTGSRIHDPPFHTPRALLDLDRYRSLSKKKKKKKRPFHRLCILHSLSFNLFHVLQAFLQRPQCCGKQKNRLQKKNCRSLW